MNIFCLSVFVCKLTFCQLSVGELSHNIVQAKYQIALSKAVVGDDWPIKALSMHIQKPYM